MNDVNNKNTKISKTADLKRVEIHHTLYHLVLSSVIQHRYH